VAVKVMKAVRRAMIVAATVAAIAGPAVMAAVVVAAETVADGVGIAVREGIKRPCFQPRNFQRAIRMGRPLAFQANLDLMFHLKDKS
jgi:hypothetical protein